MHLKLQHSFRSAQVSVWVDNDVAYAGKLTGSVRKRFGLIPTDSAQGNLSQIIPVRAGQHNIRLRIEPDDAAMQEDSIIGDFSDHSERDLTVSARHSGLSLSWQGTSSVPVETSVNFDWILQYAGSLLLTVTGSIISALLAVLKGSRSERIMSEKRWDAVRLAIGCSHQAFSDPSYLKPTLNRTENTHQRSTTIRAR